MNDTSGLPSVLVASLTTADSDRLSRAASMIRKHTTRGAAVISCHWGSPYILVDVACAAGAASSKLAVIANRLLQKAGLTQSDARVEQPDSRPAFRSSNEEPHPPVINVSIPAHFGVELTLLVGAALRPLHDRGVVLVGLCGRIDAGLRDRFDTAGLEALVRFANQLPKQRTADIYPLFSLIGARSGISRGMLERVITDSENSKRQPSMVPRTRPHHTRVPYEGEVGDPSMSAIQ